MKGKIKFISALFVVLGIVCMFTSCPGDKPVTNYTVTYVTKYGTTPDPIKVIEGTKLNASQLPVLEEEGYKFLGWYEEGAKVSADSYVVNYNVTLTAKWEELPVEKTYKVTFKTDYGKAPKAIEVVEGTKLTEEDLNTLSFNGYTFEGWLDEDGKYVEADKFTVTKDVTLKASWKKIPAKYKVTFKTEYGTAPEAIEVEEGTRLTEEQLTALTYEGYTFEGWVDEDDEPVEAGEFTVKADVTIYASWKKKTVSKFKVTYVTEYGTAPDAIEVVEGTKLTEDDLDTLSFNGYTFEGWLDEDGKYVEADKFTVTKDVTLKASWKKIPSKCKVTYVTEYGTAPDAIEVAGKSKLTANQLKVLTYDGCVFKGWKDASGKLVEADKYEVIADVTLTAWWVELGSVGGITFEVAGPSDIEIIYEEVGNLDDPAKDIKLSVKEEYDSYSWTIKTRSSISEKTKKTVTLSESDYIYGADIILVVKEKDGSNYYSAQYFIKGE